MVAEEVENSAAKNDASTLYEGADRLSQKDIRKIKQMLKEGSITLDQQDVIERLLSTLMAEQQMRLKSEEQHCRMVDNLVRNQVKLVSQFTLLIMYLLILFYCLGGTIETAQGAVSSERRRHSRAAIHCAHQAKRISSRQLRQLREHFPNSFKGELNHTAYTQSAE